MIELLSINIMFAIKIQPRVQNSIKSKLQQLMVAGHLELEVCQLQTDTWKSLSVTDQVRQIEARARCIL